MIVDNNEVNSMDDIMGSIENSMKIIKVGEVVKGKIISVTENEAIVNIGYMCDGILPKNEVSKDDSINLKDVLKADEEIYVYILDMNDGEGNVLVSKRDADTIKIWDQLETLLKDNSALDITVKEVVKGGVVAYIKDIRAFIPASQLSISFVKNLNEFVGKTLSVKVIELDKSKSKIVLSRRKVEQEELEIKKEKIWHSIEPGEKINGIVSRLTKFGAFVDLGGVDGLIHLSELSWKRVKDPSEIVSVGDNVEVYVINVDKENNKISLSLKDIKYDPWNNIEEKYKIGSVIEGVVSKFMNFGVFIELEAGVEGLVHISEIAEERILKPSDVLNIGDKVKVKVLDVNKKEKRISLSIKEALEKHKEDFAKYIDEDTSGVKLGDLLGEKLKNIKFD